MPALTTQRERVALPGFESLWSKSAHFSEEIVQAPRSEVRELFRGLSAIQLDDCLKQASVKTAPTDGFLIHEGAGLGSFHLLLSGRARIYQVSSAGYQSLLRMVLPGEVFGFWAFLPVAAAATVQAAEECRMLVWDRKTVSGMLGQYPQLTFNVLTIVARHLDELRQRYFYLTTQTVEARIAWALLMLRRWSHGSTETIIRLPKGFNQQDLAELAGTTIFTVSHVLKEWRDKKIVEKYRGQFVVRDPAALAEIAGNPG